MMQLTGYYVHGVEVDYSTYMRAGLINCRIAMMRKCNSVRRTRHKELRVRVYNRAVAVKIHNTKAQQHLSMASFGLSRLFQREIDKDIMRLRRERGVNFERLGIIANPTP
jgi:hypothetical protein